MLVLIGVLLVIIGFAIRLNPLIVVTVAGIVTALLGGMNPVQILEAFGTGFASSRSVTVFVAVLPLIGIIEYFGLQDQAKSLISKLARLTAGRVLLAYLVIRQLTAAVGLTSIGGHAQTVRPLVYPMAEGAAMRRYGYVPEKIKERIKGQSAAADNVGVFFGEDVFVAVGSILLITTFVDTTYHLQLEPLQLALWAIPTAIAALLIHGFRLLRLDKQLDRHYAALSGKDLSEEVGRAL
ncbi:DUF969 domain-containing protein [Psychromicrobium xiongbiense]|uniref:DUF969 domain-containing protein n=1 Tax=Psychromicrobium xiongbiense TaxID=3051184 RepID=UPI0025537CA7|nr:DUF969 domain-containing protein [Psychromicrobium sp. YIM S02556]